LPPRSSVSALFSISSIKTSFCGSSS
jgi:hypothetical protein